MTWNRSKGLLEDMMVKILQNSKEPMAMYEIIEVIRANHPEAIRGKHQQILFTQLYIGMKKRGKIETKICYLTSKLKGNIPCIH